MMSYDMDMNNGTMPDMGYVISYDMPTYTTYNFTEAGEDCASTGCPAGWSGDSICDMVCNNW